MCFMFPTPHRLMHAGVAVAEEHKADAQLHICHPAPELQSVCRNLARAVEIRLRATEGADMMCC